MASKNFLLVVFSLIFRLSLAQFGLEIPNDVKQVKFIVNNVMPTVNPTTFNPTLPTLSPTPYPSFKGCLGWCYDDRNSSACCNSCEDVIHYYKRKNWKYNTKNFVQCQSEWGKIALPDGAQALNKTEDEIVAKADINDLQLHIVCCKASEEYNCELTCPANFALTVIDFASWGNAAGKCGAYQYGDCNAVSTLPIITDAFLNKRSGIIKASAEKFGDPCVDGDKWLSVQAQCAPVATTKSGKVIPLPNPNKVG